MSITVFEILLKGSMICNDFLIDG